MSAFVIEPRYCGPPASGNGGYVCGRLSAFLPGSARVRLRVPPPLGTRLAVRPAAAGVELLHGDTVVAEARLQALELDVPGAPDFAAAEAAARDYRGFRSHPFPTCFVCGPARGPGDGLRIFPGPLDPAGPVAAPWIPDASLADGRVEVRPEFLWAALDCPGAFALDIPEGAPVLLGELSAVIRGTVAAGERCIVLGWNLGRDGRKHFAGTALYAESGECRAFARATWFEMPAGGTR